MRNELLDFGLSLISVLLVTLGLLLAGRLNGGSAFLSDALRRINRRAKHNDSSDYDSGWPLPNGRTNRKKPKKNGEN